MWRSPSIEGMGCAAATCKRASRRTRAAVSAGGASRAPAHATPQRAWRRWCAQSDQIGVGAQSAAICMRSCPIEDGVSQRRGAFTCRSKRAAPSSWAARRDVHRYQTGRCRGRCAERGATEGDRAAWVPCERAPGGHVEKRSPGHALRALERRIGGRESCPGRPRCPSCAWPAAAEGALDVQFRPRTEHHGGAALCHRRQLSGERR